MSNPAPNPIPAKTPAPLPLKSKLLPGAEKQHNREVGHFLKSASMHRPAINRSMPHSRGR